MTTGLIQTAYHGLLLRFPPKQRILVQFLLHHKRIPDLIEPKSFTEKIQVRKLVDRDPRMSDLIDKIAVKQMVAEVLGSDWIIPTLWEGTRPVDIPWLQLVPPLVLKASHGSGMNMFIRSLEEDIKQVAEEASTRWLGTTYGIHDAEWAYSGITPRLLIEPMLLENGRVPTDYKFWVFHGRVELIQAEVDRFGDHRRSFFDRNWNLQPITQTYRSAGHVPPPGSLSYMIDAAEELSHDFDFVRVDLYEFYDKPLFGEMTFYPDAGYKSFLPQEFDVVLGRLW